ncbi:hypothetical protein HN873_047763 [Arachis hypogaea]
MAQQITSTNSSSILDPTIVVHSSKSTKTNSDLTSILPIQPKKLFHSNITHEATTPSNGQPHVRVGAVLPKWWTVIAFKPTPLMMLTELEADVATHIFSNMLESNDSGVWVTSWMRECTLQDVFNIQDNSTEILKSSRSEEELLESLPVSFNFLNGDVG